jgi:hypothetical protein
MDDHCEAYNDARWQAIEKEIELRMQSNQMAIDKAENTMNWRLEGMNEFRATLTDQSKAFVTRTEFNALRDAHDSEMKGLSRQLYIIVGTLTAAQFLLQFFLR